MQLHPIQIIIYIYKDRKKKKRMGISIVNKVRDLYINNKPIILIHLFFSFIFFFFLSLYICEIMIFPNIKHAFLSKEKRKKQ